MSISFTVGNGSGLERFVTCCIWNWVAVALAIDVMASKAALPQTIVQPGCLQSFQSRLALVLHILPFGFGGLTRVPSNPLRGRVGGCTSSGLRPRLGHSETVPSGYKCRP